MSLNIKLVFKSEIHRLSKLPTSFAELQHYVSTVTGYSFLIIRYLDEESDEITIACDSDLFTAYASAESTGSKNLRLHLSLPASSSETATPSISREASSRTFQPVPAPSTKNHTEEEEKCSGMQTEPETDSEWVWQRHTCDGCGTSPIVGPKFHCTVCKNFDFCRECQTHTYHPHPFTRLDQENASEWVWERHTCDGCGTCPIVGPRFHCVVCGNFDFCRECEASTSHPHPFTKFVRQDNDQYMCIDIDPENLWEKFLEIKKFLFGQMPKCEVREDVSLDGRDAGDVEMRWIVRNVGERAWPAGCRVELVKGNISASFAEVPQLAPGQEAEIVGRCWSDGGDFKGKWKIVNPQGMKIAKIRAKGRIGGGLRDKIAIMMEMGFSREAAVKALKAEKGDLQKAILSLSY